MKRKFLSMALAAVLATTMLNVPVTAYADAGKATLEDMADTENPTGLINGQGTTIGEEQSIDVTNNSNYPVTVDMSFKKEEGRFNEVTTDTSVRGVFNSDKDALATNINGSSASACGIVGTPSIDLASADTEDKYTGRGTGHADINNGKTSVTMYFGLWGIPDKDKAQKDGAKAGTITVSVKPYQK